MESRKFRVLEATKTTTIKTIETFNKARINWVGWVVIETHKILKIYSPKLIVFQICSLDKTTRGVLISYDNFLRIRYKQMGIFIADNCSSATDYYRLHWITMILCE
jgi:hypothetical protein